MVLLHRNCRKRSKWSLRIQPHNYEGSDASRGAEHIDQRTEKLKDHKRERTVNMSHLSATAVLVFALFPSAQLCRPNGNTILVSKPKGDPSVHKMDKQAQNTTNAGKKTAY